MKIFLSYSVVKLSALALLPLAILKAHGLQHAGEDDPLLPFPGVWDRRL